MVALLVGPVSAVLLVPAGATLGYLFFRGAPTRREGPSPERAGTAVGPTAVAPTHRTGQTLETAAKALTLATVACVVSSLMPILPLFALGFFGGLLAAPTGIVVGLIAVANRTPAVRTAGLVVLLVCVPSLLFLVWWMRALSY
jgi:hypothetical protein